VYGRVVQCGREYATDPVRRGVEVVQPVPPEDGELRVGPDDAVEEGEDDEEERENVGDDCERGRKGADPLTPTGLEEELRLLVAAFNRHRV
jgi:hypothetical protein